MYSLVSINTRVLIYFIENFSLIIKLLLINKLEKNERRLSHLSLKKINTKQEKIIVFRFSSKAHTTIRIT